MELVQVADELPSALGALAREWAPQGAESVAQRMATTWADEAFSVIERHHAVPKYLGGSSGGQALLALEKRFHTAYHSMLIKELKARGIVPPQGKHASTKEWMDYFESTPGAQQKAFEAAQDVARYMDETYGTAIAPALQRELGAGSFTPY